MSPLGFSWGRKGTRSTRKPRTYPKRTWGAKKPRSTVGKLAAKVQKISKVVRDTTSVVQYGQTGASPIGNVAGNNIYIQPLSQYGNWTPIFGTDADDASNHNALWKSTSIDMELDTNGERSAVDYTVYIVSLTKLGQEELFTQASGGLAGPLGVTGLTQGTHFWSGPSRGFTFLNKRYFNMHFCRRYMTGSNGGQAYETASNRKRFYCKLKHNAGKGHRLSNPKGDWKALPSPQVASQNYYVLIFNNDSTADQSVYFDFNAIHTLQIA